MSRPIASVYLPGGVSRQMTTRPGHFIRFQGGEAKVYDERDMPAVLRQADAIVSPVMEKLDWLPDWMRACGEHKPPVADIRLPEGYSVIGEWPEYRLVRPLVYEDFPVEASSVVPESAKKPETTSVRRGRGRPRKEPAKEPESILVDDIFAGWEPKAEDLKD